MRKAVLGANEEYVRQSSSYGRADALLALILYVVGFTQFALLGELFIHQGSSVMDIYTFCETGIVSLIYIGFVLIFCLIRKQKLDTIGFSKYQAKRSFSLGIMLFVLVVILRGIGLKSPSQVTQTDIVSVILNIIYNLIFVAFTEEIVIRGYIGTRLYGYFKNKLLSIFIVGVMWSLYHIPFQMIIKQMSLLEYISTNWWSLIGIFIFHFIFQWLYSKYNSLIAPTILHFIWDLI